MVEFLSKLLPRGEEWGTILNGQETAVKLLQRLPGDMRDWPDRLKAFVKPAAPKSSPKAPSLGGRGGRKK